MKTAEEFIKKHCTMSYDPSGSESHRVETALSNVEEAVQAYARQEVEKHLAIAAEQVGPLHERWFLFTEYQQKLINGIKIELT